MANTIKKNVLTLSYGLLAVFLLAACHLVEDQYANVFNAVEHDAIRLDMKYYTGENLVGEPLDGYRAARCLLVPAAEQALVKVAEAARQQGYGLLIFDCYRPQRAVNHFMRWSQQPEDFSTQPSFYPNEQKHLLFERGYIAERSGHSRGATVDLGLYRLSSGDPVDFGTAFDFMDPASATDYQQLTASAVAHRQLLVALMTQHGFTNYAQEWWHYTFKPEPFPDTYFDIPVH